jgi:hypothetical protein
LFPPLLRLAREMQRLQNGNDLDEHYALKIEGVISSVIVENQTTMKTAPVAESVFS